METLTCRLYPYAVASGPANMAADELLARQVAEERMAALRFYGWSEATVSLGYFQPARVRQGPGLATLPWVRRPSGGATLVHHHELTYALAVPPQFARRAEEPWLTRMHRVIAQALANLGLAGVIDMATGPAVKHGEVLCFQQHTPGDLLCRGAKVVGSAQRKYRQALLQHGSILLARSEHAPALPGLLELTGTRLTASQVSDAILASLHAETGWRFEAAAWSRADLEAGSALSVKKYASSDWNERR